MNAVNRTASDPIRLREQVRALLAKAETQEDADLRWFYAARAIELAQLAEKIAREQSTPTTADFEKHRHIA